MVPDAVKRARDAIVRVGGGRGFVAETRRGRFVITAAHCLPALPPSHSASRPEERTYSALLGNLEGDGRLVIWAECYFADPIADVAVIGEPDEEVFGEQAKGFRAFTAARVGLPIAGIGREMEDRVEAWLMSSNDEWTECSVAVVAAWNGRMRVVVDDWTKMGLGTSGSPILASDGSALGIVSSGSVNPVLARALPSGLLTVLSDSPPTPEKEDQEEVRRQMREMLDLLSDDEAEQHIQSMPIEERLLWEQLRRGRQASKNREPLSPSPIRPTSQSAMSLKEGFELVEDLRRKGQLRPKEDPSSS